MRIKFLVLILAISLSYGCSEPKNKPVYKESPSHLVQMVDNTQLAKIILRPKQKELVISRDPFKPILSKNMNLLTGSEGVNSDVPGGQSAAEDVILIGVVKLGEDFRAFMKVGSKSGVYKSGEKVGLYTIQGIEIDKVILMTPDNHRIVKVRGKA